MEKPPNLLSVNSSKFSWLLCVFPLTNVVACVFDRSRIWPSAVFRRTLKRIVVSKTGHGGSS